MHNYDVKHVNSLLWNNRCITVGEFIKHFTQISVENIEISKKLKYTKINACWISQWQIFQFDYQDHFEKSPNNKIS